MTKLGKFVFTLAVLALAAWGIYRWMQPQAGKPTSPQASSEEGRTQENTSTKQAAKSGEASDSEKESFDFLPPGPAPKLGAAQPYRLVDNTVVLNLSEYAGYAGLILANKGLEPNEESWFTKKGGFKL